MLDKPGAFRYPLTMMKKTPELETTYVRELEGENAYEYGWIMSRGLVGDLQIRVGQTKNREQAHNKARQLMRMKVV